MSYPQKKEGGKKGRYELNNFFWKKRVEFKQGGGTRRRWV